MTTETQGYLHPEESLIPIHPDGRPQQIEDRGSDSWCLAHGRVPWANDGICGACESEYYAEDASAEYERRRHEFGDGHDAIQGELDGHDASEDVWF